MKRELGAKEVDIIEEILTTKFDFDCDESRSNIRLCNSSTLSYIILCKFGIENLSDRTGEQIIGDTSDKIPEKIIILLRKNAEIVTYDKIRFYFSKESARKCAIKIKNVINWGIRKKKILNWEIQKEVEKAKKKRVTPEIKIKNGFVLEQMSDILRTVVYYPCKEDMVDKKPRAKIIQEVNFIDDHPGKNIWEECGEPFFISKKDLKRVFGFITEVDKNENH